MSNKAVRHSSRYKGPSGDSRPPAEIFAKMERRGAEAIAAQDGLNAYLDGMLASRELISGDGMIELIWETVVCWRANHEVDFAKLVKRITPAPTE